MPLSPAPQLTPRWVTRTLGCVTKPSPASEKNPDQPFSQISTDSRKITPGCLFVALQGEKFDAHEFIGQAVAQGARGIIHEEGRALPKLGSEVFLFPVPDTQRAYRQLGAAWRKLFRIPVVMVAGSAGKTTTKELLTAALRGKWPEVLKTQGSQNGFVGIPMTLLELRPGHRAAVIEVGIDEIGAMQEHVELVAPEVSLLTAIGPEHLEKLRDLETVAREEGIGLTAVAERGGKVAVNLDDTWIAPYFERVPKAVRRLGYRIAGQGAARVGAGSDGASPQIITGKISEDLRSLDVEGGDFRTTERFGLPLPGRHNAMNLLSAIAASQCLGLSASEIREGLRNFSGAEGRSQLTELPFRGGTLQIILDYYNSQPASVAAGLELLTQLSHAGRPPRPRWACLADMLELGSEEERYHREIADPLIRFGVENVLLYGPRMRWLEDELRKRGYAGRLRHFETHPALAAELRDALQPGEAVLIKGSRGMRMEEVWKLLTPAS